LFAVPARPAPGQQHDPQDPVAAALAALNPDDLSPREAMEALYRLKEQAAK
jgi:DNA mismatch repair protein MutS